MQLFSAHAAADERDWDYRPYRIHLIVAVDLPGGLADQLGENVPAYLQRRAHAAIGPLWSLDVAMAIGPLRQQVLAESESLSDQPPANLPSEADKLVLVGVRWRPDGLVLTAREFDRYVQRWSVPIRRICRQEQALLEQLFAITAQAVRPLARLELDPDKEDRVTFQPRGAAIARPNSAEPWAAPGDVFLPVLRRTARSGEVIEGGVQPVPWTYVEMIDEDHGQRGRIHSGTRRPFGVRRQGRVEQVAIALRADPADTLLRLHSRTNPDKPLVGYEVYAQDTPAAASDSGSNESLSRIGATDRHGMLSLPAGDRVRMLYLKNGDQLLARLPIVPGAEPQLDVLLPDDDPRLTAETRLAALREELIDVVARRDILMARARQKIKESDFAAAQQFVNAINELPGRSQFNLTLTTTARLVKSDDPQIQRRIDQLFEATQMALSQHLDTRPVAELSNELREAQRK